jgi:hypothetical protein
MNTPNTSASRRAPRRAYHVSELPEATMTALKAARMNPVHDDLNSLLDD